jgi:alpha-glucan,water dikinase
MKSQETIATQSGWPLSVETRATNGCLEVIFESAPPKPCVLHWGVRRATEKEWQIPPQSSWPAETQAAGKNAVQSPFPKPGAASPLVIRLAPQADFVSLDFVLFFPGEKRWDNNRGRNYRIPLTESAPSAVSPLEALQAQIGGGEAAERTFERAFEVNGRGQLAAMTTKRGDRYRVSLLSNLPGNLVLHWGIARRSPQEWLLPPESMRGPETVLSQERTAQTPFAQREGFNALNLEFAQADAPLGIQFVLKQSDNGGKWINYRGGNFYVPIHAPLSKPASPGIAQFHELADEIICSERDHNSWTLMHRFNLCHDLLDRVANDVEGLALLYVWLRFSAIRQLTWQRNFNTKPRELAHAQDRLTHKFAELFQREAAARPILRRLLVTVGRGGEGQEIRDEILNIMHRHHVKEVSGHFLEEWHQKLHNNTTPDDVVICEGYLEFLRSNGNVDLFYQTLEAGGVTRQRLEHFERPIRSSPQFAPHLKDGLIGDFEHFLKILKASHSATDFETAINATRNQLGDNLRGVLDHLWWHRNDPGEPLVPFVSGITEVRRSLPAHFQAGQNVRELLYLDLALEQLLRGVVERNIHLQLDGDQLTELILQVLENVTFSNPDAELSACCRHWARLQSPPRFSVDWALRAKSVTERASRALASWIDRIYQLFQPKAEYLGHGFQAEAWTITLFSEEVVRGGSLGFVLSLLLHHLDPLLRQAAQLGDWQIVSRGRGAGKVVVVDSLRSVQRTRFDEPTVVLTDQVMGDEEIPEGVTAVIAPDVTDIVSHVAVRARNAHILFASCHNPATLQRLKAMKGQLLQLDVKSDGEVIVAEHAASAAVPPPQAKRLASPPVPGKWSEKYAVTSEEFNDRTVGGKSCNLARLRRQLPEWIHVPVSVALPFGAFERVLKLGINQELAGRYQALTRQGDKAADEKTLAALRECVLALPAPEELRTELHEAMNAAGLAWPDKWDKAWNRIKQVWASKWNDRAFLSRQRMGIPHENLCMAVLVQQVVPADYAFVIHTVNPTNGNRDELYAEIVLGLGETLVGNHPGRALRLACNKTTGHQRILAYPSKSFGLYGGGLIFRSDSNGEDLAGYAGAGLYDSVLLDPPTEKLLDYSQERLIWDEGFRRDLFAGILRLGLEVERVSGSPQDIEGAISQGKSYVVQTRPQVGAETPR